jgi:hypothetical protein
MLYFLCSSRYKIELIRYLPLFQQLIPYLPLSNPTYNQYPDSKTVSLLYPFPSNMSANGCFTVMLTGAHRYKFQNARDRFLYS